MADLVIVDYGAGNVKSVEFALKRLGASPVLSSNPEEVANAKRVIFPGVGNAGFAMEKLCENGMNEAIKALKVPVLGICLGMQLMCRDTEEADVKGLGVFDTSVKLFPAEGKIPHMGWNSITATNNKLWEGSDVKSYFYFVHSFYAETCVNTSAVCNYIIPFSAMLQNDNFFGCQFHPEKSGPLGEKLLQKFLKL